MVVHLVAMGADFLHTDRESYSKLDQKIARCHEQSTKFSLDNN